MKTVLLVDDDSRTRRLVDLTLRDANQYELLHADSGAAALEQIKKRRVDLVILDVMMPGFDGFTICRALSSLPDELRPRVAMLTARALPSDRRRAIEAGADTYITKPFSPIQLVEQVVQLLSMRPRCAAA